MKLIFSRFLLLASAVRGLIIRQSDTTVPALQQQTQQLQSTHGGYPSPDILNTASYTFYSGDGSIAAGWPNVTDWLDFSVLWATNGALMNSSCSAKGSNIADNSPAETSALLDAINAEAAATGVDARFILAVVMQESSGCVRVGSTASPEAAIQNPGLMQSHTGNGTCNADGTVQDPCPNNTITQMVADGTAGTASGDGLQQCLSLVDASAGEAAQYYRAARMYNSGRVDASGDLGNGCCTHCYASDIANRLRGWVNAPSSCTLDDDDDDSSNSTTMPTTSGVLTSTVTTGGTDWQWTSTDVAALATATANDGQWSASSDGSENGQWSQWSS